MQIKQIKLQGFRNFKDTTINFENKSLIIGTNDVGKTNLLYAIRLLLDKNLSEQHIEPMDSDFFAFEETNLFSITILFIDVADNVRSHFREAISDDNMLYLRYEAIRDEETRKKEYSILAGKDENSFEIRPRSSYIRALNIKYISSYRDLYTYIKREKRGLMEEAKGGRTNEEIESDQNIINSIETDISRINSKISEINYIEKATIGLNNELQKLSFHHSSHNIVFSATGQDIERFVDGSELSSIVNGKKLNLGGDGRNNQIFLALWAARNTIETDPSVTTIFAIEEPEAHLHPQQQKRLAEYLINALNSQVLLTSHSPHILSMFSPNSIIRLFQTNSITKAANNGCSYIIDDAFTNFGYRRSIISSEAFFANTVLLVEGASEVVFYTILGKDILELYNISIMMVDGIGFEAYTKILKALQIPYVIRTDNDIFKVPRSNPSTFYFAGINRGFWLCDERSIYENKFQKFLHAFSTKTPLDDKNYRASKLAISFLLKRDIFIADIDFENDLARSEIYLDLCRFYDENNLHDENNLQNLVDKMQQAKGGNIFNFLQINAESLEKLKSPTNKLYAPLKRCLEIAQKII